MSNLIRFAAVTTAALAFLLSACEEKPAAVVGEAPAAVIESDEPDAPSEDAAPEVTPVGTKVAVGDWEVKVTKVQLNAANVIQGANEFNEKAAGQYVLVTYEASYKVRPVEWWGLRYGEAA
jgi:hypothetical protein